MKLLSEVVKSVKKKATTQKITNKKNPCQMVSELDVVGGL
jgi:hypothetical protein